MGRAAAWAQNGGIQRTFAAAPYITTTIRILNGVAVFPYDPALISAVQTVPQSVADVLQVLQTIDTICAAGDGLKWFNWRASGIFA